MNEFLKRLSSQVSNIFNQTSKIQKIIIVSVLLIGIVGIGFTVFLSSRRSGALLFKTPLAQDDAREVLSVLDASGIIYEYRSGLITLSEEDRANAELELVKEGKMPTGIDGWEIFDSPRVGITDMELDINKRRALTRSITQLLMELDFVKSVRVDLAFPKKEYLTDIDSPVTASVIIEPKPFMSEKLQNVKTVKGLQKLIAMGVDKLTPEFVTISDNSGVVLTDYTDESADIKIRIAQEEMRIVDRERQKIQNKIAGTLDRIYSNRVETTIALELIWDEVIISNALVIPIVLQEDDPSTPYPDGIVTNKVPISTITSTEEWRGQQFIPQGAAGAEENVPPGYQDKMDMGQTYTKSTEQENYELSKRYEAIKKGSYQIGKISAAIAIDGRWEKEYTPDGAPVITNNNGYSRIYFPVTPEEIRNVTTLVQAAIGYSVRRGDLVAVTHIQFDHWEKFRMEDADFIRQGQMKKAVIMGMIGLLALFLLILAFRIVQKELARRRRLKDEELQRRQMEMRRQAMMTAAETPMNDALLEDTARKKLLEEVSKMSTERPDDVAQLLRTWIAEDKQ